MTLPIFTDTVVRVRDQLMAELGANHKPNNCQVASCNCKLQDSNTIRGCGGEKKRKERIIQQWMKTFIKNTGWSNTRIGRGALRNLVKAYGGIKPLDKEITNCGSEIAYKKNTDDPVRDEGAFLNTWLQDNKPE